MPSHRETTPEAKYLERLGNYGVAVELMKGLFEFGFDYEVRRSYGAELRQPQNYIRDFPAPPIAGRLLYLKVMHRGQREVYGTMEHKSLELQQHFNVRMLPWVTRQSSRQVVPVVGVEVDLEWAMGFANWVRHGSHIVSATVWSQGQRGSSWHAIPHRRTFPSTGSGDPVGGANSHRVRRPRAVWG